MSARSFLPTWRSRDEYAKCQTSRIYGERTLSFAMPIEAPDCSYAMPRCSGRGRMGSNCRAFRYSAKPLHTFMQ